MRSPIDLMIGHNLYCFRQLNITFDASSSSSSSSYNISISFECTMFGDRQIRQFRINDHSHSPTIYIGHQMFQISEKKVPQLKQIDSSRSPSSPIVDIYVPTI